MADQTAIHEGRGLTATAATANVGTAEWDVARYGWADWSGDDAACGF